MIKRFKIEGFGNYSHDFGWDNGVDLGQAVETEEEFTALFKELDDERYGGYTTALDKGGYLVLMKEGYKDFTIFIHEIFHVANLILFDREVEYSRTFESLAYLLGWMAQQYADYVLWKPSKEQLAALQAANDGCSYDISVLASLLDELKDITKRYN